MPTLNERSMRLIDALAADADRYRVGVSDLAGARVVDCGVTARGGLAAGLMLARITAGDLLDVTLAPDPDHAGGPVVQVRTDDPVRACLAAQYAGWQIAVGKYFGMGSGPMRALYAQEPLFGHLPGREASPVGVGAIEGKKLPPAAVVEHLANKLGLPTDRLALAVAPAASLAGGVQVVARSVETALHKLHELKFDVTQVVSGYGTAPLPPVAADELAAIGRTNDAILYGGRVTLWVDCPDAEIDAVGPRVPSSASTDHGTRFAELFARYGDFYKIDPLLFSPAEVTFVNVATGRCRAFGRVEPDIIRASFFGV